jgi:hypothetical protein
MAGGKIANGKSTAISPQNFSFSAYGTRHPKEAAPDG